MLLLAAVLMIARPVMACCWVGHGESTEAPAAHAKTASMTPAAMTQPPCHGGGEMPQLALEAEPSCENCADCDNPLLAAADVEARIAAQLLVDAVLVSYAPPVPVSTRSAHAPRDGPARQDSPSKDTPISLKQRLLI
jgi:hypothetical protein